jgi:hypothetical protein
LAIHFLHLGVNQNPSDETASPVSALLLFKEIAHSQTGSSTLGIELHSSWISLMKLAKHSSIQMGNQQWLFLVRSYDKILGLLASDWLGP